MEFKAFESIQIYQSVQHDCVELLNCQQSHYTDWLIQIDSNALNSFGLILCNDHVEQALLFYRWITTTPTECAGPPLLKIDVSVARIHDQLCSQVNLPWPSHYIGTNTKC